MRQQADNVYLIWYQPGTGRPVQQSTPARTIGYIPSAQAEENYHLTQTDRIPMTVTLTKHLHNSELTTRMNDDRKNIIWQYGCCNENHLQTVIPTGD